MSFISITFSASFSDWSVGKLIIYVEASILFNIRPLNFFHHFWHKFFSQNLLTFLHLIFEIYYWHKIRIFNQHFYLFYTSICTRLGFFSLNPSSNDTSSTIFSLQNFPRPTPPLNCPYPLLSTCPDYPYSLLITSLLFFLFLPHIICIIPLLFQKYV